MTIMIHVIGPLNVSTMKVFLVSMNIEVMDSGRFPVGMPMVELIVSIMPLVFLCLNLVWILLLASAVVSLGVGVVMAIMIHVISIGMMSSSSEVMGIINAIIGGMMSSSSKIMRIIDAILILFFSLFLILNFSKSLLVSSPGLSGNFVLKWAMLEVIGM